MRLVLPIFLVLAWLSVASDDIFSRQLRSLASADELAGEARWLVKPEAPYPFPPSAVKEVNGNLGFVIDGEPTGAYWRSVGATTLPGAPVERLLREEGGVRWFIIDTDIHGPLDDEASRAFGQFADRASKVLASVPDARFIVRVWMINTAAEFSELYPDSVLTGPDGKTDWGWRYAGGGKTRPNVLADWRSYCGEHLYRLVHRIGQSEYAAHTAGFYLGALNSGEWWYYKGKTDPGWDYSPARLAAFQRLLSQKYGERVPWAPTTPISEIQLPTLAQRGQRPLLPQTAAVDYLQTLNLPITYAATYFAGVVKAASSGRALVGIETGAGFACFPNNGTVYLRQMLECPNIDFLGGPSSYHRRGQGRAPLHRVADASLRANGKLWFNEGDYRTHMAYGTRSGRAGEPSPDLAGMRHILRREFARGIVEGYPTYLMDFGWNWWHDRGLAAEIGRLQRVAELLQAEDLSQPAEVAVVTDQESQLYTNYFANPIRLRERVLEQLGCSTDFHELRDFLSADTSAYKLVIFLNLRSLTGAERQALQALRGENRTLLWLHDPGFVDLDGSADPARLMSSVVGMKLRTGVAPTGQVRVVDETWQHHFGHAAENPLPLGELNYPLRRTQLAKEVSLSDTAEGLVMGNAIGSVAVDDPAATVLAVDEAGHCRLAVRDTPHWRSYYAAGCLLTVELLNDIATHAGVRRYVDTRDIVYANRRILAIHATTDGERHVSLPDGDGVCDLLTGKQLANPLIMKRGETRLLFRGDSVAWTKRLASLDARAETERQAFVQAHPALEVSDAAVKQFRVQSPAAFYAQHAKYLKAPPTWDGPYPLSALTPRAWLIAGPFGELDDAAAAAVQPMPTPMDDWAVDRHANRFLQPVEPLPQVTLTEAVWRPLFVPSSWVQADQLGLSDGQSLLFATYLATQSATTIEMLFASEGDGDLWLDGQLFDGEQGAFGKRVELSAGRHRLMVRLRQTEGPAGFTCKILTPDQPGQTARQSPKDVGVWLTPGSK